MSSQDFNTFKIYMKVARELQANNPIVSYYLKAYAVNKAVEYLKIERSKGVDIKEKTVQIKDWLQDLEELKAQLSSELANKEQCKHGYQTFAYGLYEKSDKEYRNGNFTRNLAKDFLYVSVLFDAWELSGGKPEDVKNEKNYANQARFQIIEIMDQGKNQPTANTASPTANPANNAYKDAHSHIRPPTTPTGATDTDQKKKDTVDPLAKLNFDLTESIVVPKSAIDGFLDGTRPDVKVAARAVLDSLTDPPQGVQTPPNNVNKTPNNPLGLPIGKSVTLDDTMAVNGAQNAIYPNPSNNGFVQNLNIGPGQYNPSFCMPNTGYPGIQRQYPQSQFQAITSFNQPGYPNFGQNYPQSTFQCTYNQQAQPNVLRELQNRAEPSVFGGNKEQQKGNSENTNNVDGNTKMKCQEAKTLCLKAANELDLTNIKQAKEKIWQALSILEEMEDRQGQ